MSLLSTAVEVLVGRETDAADLRNLAVVATEDEWRLASEAVQLTQKRGYARGVNQLTQSHRTTWQNELRETLRQPR